MDWALATRFQADRDLVVESGFRALPLDPSLGGKRIGAKAGFDLTLPLGERALAHTVGRALNESTQDLLPRPLGTPRYLRYASDMESELLTSPTPRPPDRSIMYTTHSAHALARIARARASVALTSTH